MACFNLCVLFCVFICVPSVLCQLELEEGAPCVDDKEGLQGSCVHIHRCLAVVSELKKRAYPQICSFKGREPIVCCTDCELVNDTRTVLYANSGAHFFKTGRKAIDLDIIKFLIVGGAATIHIIRGNRLPPITWDLNISGEKMPRKHGEFRVPMFFIGGSTKGSSPRETMLHNGQQVSLIFRSGRWLQFEKRGLSSYECLKHIVRLGYPCSLKNGLQRVFVDSTKCYTYEAPFFIAGVGGVDAKEGEYPHMALLGYGDELQSAQWLCGGSVISDSFILTAAHCISSNTLGSVKYVALGILKRTDPADQWQRYNVKRIIRHPQYQPPNKYHDIALLEVEGKIKFSRLVLPACLDTGDSNQQFATATGWGALGHRKELADTLQVVKLQQFTAEECAAAYPPHRHLQNGYDHSTQMCYGDKDKIIDTCEGDSGGPLQVVSTYGTCIFKIIGVTSYGRACGFPGGTGMYTRVEYYVPWIESVVWP